MRDAKAPRPRLRERNKERTRETIARAAVDLFAEDGYAATTLVAIAATAGVAPSTLHVYFPLKEDLLFSVYDAVLESARRHLVEERGSQAGIAALSNWVAETLPAVLTRYGADHLIHTYEITTSDPALAADERSRDALLEDIFAAAFANDFAPGELLRAKVAATIALHAIKEVWEVWIHQHASDGEVALTELTELGVNHVRELLAASEAAIELLPHPGDVGLKARALSDAAATKDVRNRGRGSRLSE